MPSNKTITPEMFIRNLPYGVFLGLCSILDIDEQWKDLVVKIPKRLDSDDFEPRYSQMNIRTFALKMQRPNGSPACSVLEDWGTQNAQVRHLLQVLNKAMLLSSVSYLKKYLPPSPEQSGETQCDGDKDVEDGDDQEKNLTENGSELCNEHDDKFSLTYSNGESSVGNNNISFDSEPGVSVGSAPSNSCTSPRIPTENADPEFPEDVLSHREAPYVLLANITNNFDDSPLLQGGRLVGSGGFGQVFLGIFPNKLKVAVKRLVINEGVNMEKQFVTELKTLSTYRHSNIVSILGYSRDNVYKCLVYEFMENGSLEDRLACKDGTAPLTAKQRMTIARGTANGINYLHSKGLIHRDIKSANVLLNSDFFPKVGDFATVRTGPRGNKTAAQSTSVVIGTSAYLAPEATRFDVSTKLDSFSFGIVLLELLTGLPPLDSSREDEDLLTHIESNIEDDDILPLVDPKAGPWDEKQANCLFKMSNQCTVHKKKDRVLIETIIPDFQKLNLVDE